jgi:hypothetical protein
MSLTIPLPPGEEARLLANALSEGTTPERLVRRAILPDLTIIGCLSTSTR